jgi:ppGpp synthetase/RelA/SpoT-type nucleotidyltranferase
VKDCESAVEKLLRRHEGNIFDPEKPVESLLTLKDLAGARVLVFPFRRLSQVDEVIRRMDPFKEWTADPLKYAGGQVQAPKYYGVFESISREIQGEYQIVPMLIGSFWEVEHSAMYKPVGWAKGADRDQDLKTLRTEIERSLLRFEEKFESFVEQNRQSSPKSQ